MYHNARVAWELYGPGEEDYLFLRPDNLKPRVRVDPGDAPKWKLPQRSEHDPGTYRLRAATVDLAGRTTVVWQSFDASEIDPNDETASIADMRTMNTACSPVVRLLAGPVGHCLAAVHGTCAQRSIRTACCVSMASARSCTACISRRSRQTVYAPLPMPDFQVIHAAANREFLDKAHAHGCVAGSRQARTPTSIRKIVAEFGKHPAVLFWETEDEPSYQWNKPGPRISAGKIRAAYALLKQLDPERLVYLNHAPTNLVSTLQAYNPGGDILATDIYPVIPHGIRELYGLWPTGRQGDLADTHISQVGPPATKFVTSPARLGRLLWFCRHSRGKTCARKIAIPLWFFTRTVSNFGSWRGNQWFME